MRDHYPTCLLIGDNSESFIELCRSLRFSTHCAYKILASEAPFELDNFIHMEWSKLGALAINALPVRETVLFISLIEGRLSVNSVFVEHQEDYNKILCRELKAVAETLQATSDQSKQFLKEFVEMNFSGIKRILDAAPGELRLDVLMDFESDPVLLSGFVRRSNGRVSLLGNNERELLVFGTGNEADKRYLSETITFSFSKDERANEIHSRIVHNEFQRHWKAYRAAGINVPLIMVQNLLGRKVRTRYFIDPNDIAFLDEEVPRYIFDYDVVYFDLDETLICKGKPIQDLRKLLHDYRDVNYVLKLITRHKFDIKDTLASIDVDHSIFHEIIPVLPDEKKSSFIDGRAIFIDNEFPERLDVSQKSQIPVLDLDQIEFLQRP
ncbi:hypothetical protein [Roseibium polysiphoniae]|uniref:Uncharacterized protein n=1 Tax=Roseibium polysiphoniae TaxID=2571221 RepID=A0ABR9C9S0_9HYPH|nr:hypothetical protein [Roseibium polysiphoniae]MBD8876656.1 hypothetical protein [Roseibium polysiphoniae]